MQNQQPTNQQPNNQKPPTTTNPTELNPVETYNPFAALDANNERDWRNERYKDESLINEFSEDDEVFEDEHPSGRLSTSTVAGDAPSDIEMMDTTILDLEASADEAEPDPAVIVDDDIVEVNDIDSKETFLTPPPSDDEGEIGLIVADSCEQFNIKNNAEDAESTPLTITLEQNGHSPTMTRVINENARQDSAPKNKKPSMPLFQANRTSPVLPPPETKSKKYHIGQRGRSDFGPAANQWRHQSSRGNLPQRTFKQFSRNKNPVKRQFVEIARHSSRPCEVCSHQAPIGTPHQCSRPSANISGIRNTGFRNPGIRNTGFRNTGVNRRTSAIDQRASEWERMRNTWTRMEKGKPHQRMPQRGDPNDLPERWNTMSRANKQALWNALKLVDFTAIRTILLDMNSHKECLTETLCKELSKRCILAVYKGHISVRNYMPNLRLEIFPRYHRCSPAACMFADPVATLTYLNYPSMGYKLNSWNSAELLWRRIPLDRRARVYKNSFQAGAQLAPK